MPTDIIFGCACALLVEKVEGVAAVGEKVLAGAEVAGAEFHVVVGERIGHDQMRLAVLLHVVGQVVVVGVAVIEKTAFLDDQAARVARSARSGSTSRAGARRPCCFEARDRARDVAPLLVLASLKCSTQRQPWQQMSWPAATIACGGRRMALERQRAAEDRHRQLALGEKPHDPPEAGAAAVLEHPFGGEIALAGRAPARLGSSVRPTSRAPDRRCRSEYSEPSS